MNDIRDTDVKDDIDIVIDDDKERVLGSPKCRRRQNEADSGRQARKVPSAKLPPLSTGKDNAMM